jgi:hypothetical protein
MQKLSAGFDLPVERQACYEESQRVCETFSDDFCRNRPHGVPRSLTNAISGITYASDIDGTPANIIGSGSERANCTPGNGNPTGYNSGCEDDKFKHRISLGNRRAPRPWEGADEGDFG